MDSGEKITIIIACYNVENYLSRCFDSILGQTYANVEVIAVDDCSTDGTKNIIKKYVKRYKNFNAIYNSENRGQGYSRNVAIDSVKTKYIAFVDSDDWVEPNFLEELHTTIKIDGNDLAVCDIFVKHDNAAADHRVTMYDTKPDRFGLINVGLAASSCNKLYKTELFNNLRYPENLANDDIQVIIAILYNYKAGYTKNTYYNYYQRRGSTQNGNITHKRLDVFKSIEFLKSNIKGKVDNKTWDAIVWHQVIIVLMVVVPKAKSILYRKRLIEDFCALAEDNNIDIINNHGLAHFRALGQLNRVYGYGVKFFIKRRLYLLCSIFMSFYNFCLNHKSFIKTFARILHAPIVLVRDPVGFMNKLRAYIFPKNVIKHSLTLQDLINAAKQNSKLNHQNPVTVVIPNYNYEKFLIERLYSILYQTHKIGEILILDDNSTDNSVELANKIKASIDRYIEVRLINNIKNQGTFKQWKKGFNQASNGYVWIAEADDYSHRDFLTSVMRPYDDNSDIVMSYADTGFIDAGGLFIESAKRHIDYQKSGHWDKDYVIDGVEEIRKFTYLNNTIANVSSVVFRKDESIDYEKLFLESADYKQAGDWVFYTNYSFYGDIAYVNKTLNYYRMHGSNVSASTKAKIHLTEILKIYKMIDDRLGLTKEQRRKQVERIELLKKAWNI